MFKNKRLASIQLTIKRTEGGITKRLDENRELLQLINDKYPELLKNAPWIEGWLKSQEKYLLAVATVADITPDMHVIREWPDTPYNWKKNKELKSRAVYETLATIPQCHKQLKELPTTKMTKAITDNFNVKVEYKANLKQENKA